MGIRRQRARTMRPRRTRTRTKRRVGFYPERGACRRDEVVKVVTMVMVRLILAGDSLVAIGTPGMDGREGEGTLVFLMLMSVSVSLGRRISSTRFVHV